jgi:hypothetical protein
VDQRIRLERLSRVWLGYMMAIGPAQRFVIRLAVTVQTSPIVTPNPPLLARTLSNSLIKVPGTVPRNPRIVTRQFNHRQPSR